MTSVQGGTYTVIQLMLSSGDCSGVWCGGNSRVEWTRVS